MTNREFYSAIASTENLSAELVEFANAAIAKMDAANAKRREAVANGTAAPRKVDAETLAKRAAILNALTAEPQFAEQIAAVTGYSKNTVNGVMRAFVTDGTVIKGKAKPEGGKAEVNTYALASTLSTMLE